MAFTLYNALHEIGIPPFYTPMLDVGIPYHHVAEQPARAAWARKIVDQALAQKITCIGLDLEDGPGDEGWDLSWDDPMGRFEINLGHVVEMLREFAKIREEKNYAFRVTAYAAPARAFHEILPVAGSGVAAWSVAKLRTWANVVGRTAMMVRALAQLVDFFAPGLYTLSNSIEDWTLTSRVTVQLIRQFTSTGYKIRPYLWHSLAKQDVPAEMWAAQLDWVKAYCDGLVLWCGPVYGQPCKWDPARPWVKELDQRWAMGLAGPGGGT